MAVGYVTAAEFDPTSEKATRKERKADKLVESMAYQSAVDLYQEVLQKNSNNIRVHLKLAEAYVKLNDTDQAEHHFRQYITRATLSPQEKLQFARVLVSNQKLTEAEVWVLAYQKDVPRSVVAKNLLQSIRFHDEFYKDSADFTVEPLSFNTDQVEFAPAYYQQGLVFASSRKQQLSLKKKYHWDRSNYLDLYQVSLDGESASEPIPFEDLNSKLHEGPVTFFDNEQQVILTRNHYRTTNHKTGDGVNTLQLFHAQKAENGNWEDITPLPFNGMEFSTGHPAYEDGVLYYASNKEGGYGGVDLYRVTYTDGEWGRSENLGPQINTEGDEQFPFVKDGVLYFASNAHAGLGGLDIFKTKIQEDGTITEIVNLGYPINSAKDDFGYITKDGNHGYFSTHRDGSDDIYQFKNRVPISSPEEAIMASMQPTQDEISKLPDHITEKNRGFLAAFSQADMVVMGQRTYLLADQKILEVRQDQDGYMVMSDEGGIKVRGDDESLQLDGALKTLGITVNGRYDVGTIYYGFDRSNIREDAAAELDQLAQLLEKHQNLKLNMDSHTDSRGSSGYNDALSKRRSQAAKQYLMAAGIDESRLFTTAHGESNLINQCADNNPCAETDHQKNRRTQFSLVI